MWELDHKEGWAQRIDAFELWCWIRHLRVLWTARRSNQSALKEINPDHTGTDAEAEAPILWPLDAKSWLIRKDPDAGKDWRQEEKGPTEDEMVGEGADRAWDGWMASPTQWTWVWASSGRCWSLECCSPQDRKELDTTEQLNNNNKLINELYLIGLKEIECLYSFSEI